MNEQFRSLGVSVDEAESAFSHLGTMMHQLLDSKKIVKETKELCFDKVKLKNYDIDSFGRRWHHNTLPPEVREAATGQINKKMDEQAVKMLEEGKRAAEAARLAQIEEERLVAVAKSRKMHPKVAWIVGSGR